MTTRHVIELDTFFLLTISAVSGIVFAMSSSHKQSISYSLSVPVNEIVQSPIPPSIPSTIEKFTQTAPNGANMLRMITTNRDSGKTYEILVSDLANNNQKLIYSATLPVTESITVPFNAWSPDNKYLFIEHNTPKGNEAIVIKSNGDPVIQGEVNPNIAALFAAKKTGYTYKETTGWASETLLIVNTTGQDGSKGPSYWFEVPSKAIIQLSTQF